MRRRGGGKRPKAVLVRDIPEADLGPRAPTRAERLDYIAAMLCELKAMSTPTQCPALTVLLELAYRKAVKERRTG
jgi:23S rRNA A1618 N6-methylase RlmF